MELRLLLWCKKGWEEKPKEMMFLMLSLCCGYNLKESVVWPGRGHTAERPYLSRDGTLVNKSQLGICCCWGWPGTVANVVQLCFSKTTAGWITTGHTCTIKSYFFIEGTLSPSRMKSPKLGREVVVTRMRSQTSPFMSSQLVRSSFLLLKLKYKVLHSFL